jgi:fructose-bisphosphate aldolase class 1
MAFFFMEPKWESLNDGGYKKAPFIYFPATAQTPNLQRMKDRYINGTHFWRCRILLATKRPKPCANKPMIVKAKIIKLQRSIVSLRLIPMI